MAKNVLPTNFKDDMLAPSMAGKRRYKMIQNSDGTISLEDVSEYGIVGSNFGQAQINATNTAVNESADKNKIIDSLSSVMANTNTGYMAGALSVKELNSNLGKIYTRTRSGVTLNTGIEYSFVSLALPHGLYFVTGVVLMAVNANHFISISGTEMYARVQNSALSNYQSVSAIVEVNDENTVNLIVYQASGENITGVKATIKAVRIK